MVNQITLIGNLGADPELKTVGDTTLAKLRLATSERFKDRSGELVEKTQWHSVVFWGKAAEIIGQYCSKGSKLFVMGSVEYQSYDKDAETRWSTQIKGRDFKFLDAKGEGGGGSKSKPSTKPNHPDFDDDLPF